MRLIPEGTCEPSVQRLLRMRICDFSRLSFFLRRLVDMLKFKQSCAQTFGGKDGLQRIGISSERVKYWLSIGAQPSDTVSRLLFLVRILPKPPKSHIGKKGPPPVLEAPPSSKAKITLNHILTKVSWSKVMSLVSLGRAWQTAVRGREVYDAQARAGTKQTHVAIIHDDLTLISWRLLSKILGIRCGILDGCGCILVSGKLYVSGGRGEPLEQFSSRVYEFDCAGKGMWAQRASMLGGQAVFA